MPKIRHLVFLMGTKRAGKDTVAEMINKMSFNQYDVIGFADALKKEYWETQGIEYSRETEDHELKEKHRPGIIRYGEGKKQEHGMFYWIERALDEALLDTESKKGIIVPDCRRVEEVIWMKDFMLRRHEKYADVYDSIDPDLFLVYRPDVFKDDDDYLTQVALRVATEEMMMVNRLIKNDKDLKHLKVIVEELYACRLK